MFPLWLAELSPDQLIIEYTEYLFREKVEKKVFLDENYVEYVGNYVYAIIQETASLMADVTSSVYDQAIHPIVTITSDSIFQLISVSTDFLADFSKIQMVCIMALACLLFGINKSIRTTRIINKELKTYESIIKHVQWQFNMERPNMEEITRRLSKSSESRIPSTMSKMENLYTILDTRSHIQHRLSIDNKFWTPLIMAEVRKLDHINKIWQDGTELDRVKEIRDRGRHVDIEVTRIKRKIEALKESIKERKTHPNLCFDELAYCNPDGSPIEFFSAAEGFNFTVEFEAAEEYELSSGLTAADSSKRYEWVEREEPVGVNGLSSSLTSADSTEVLSYPEGVEAVEANHLTSVWTSAESAKKLDWAERVEGANAEEIDFNLLLTWADETEATWKNGTVAAAAEKELGSDWTSADSTEGLSWAERVEAANTEEIDFSLILTWADDQEATQENETVAFDSQLRFDEKIEAVEAVELNLVKYNTDRSWSYNPEESECKDFNGQGDNGDTKLSRAERVELSEQMEAENEKGTVDEGFVEVDCYSVGISWADQVDATYPLEDTYYQTSSLSWAEQVDEAERLGQL